MEFDGGATTNMVQRLEIQSTVSDSQDARLLDKGGDMARAPLQKHALCELVSQAMAVEACCIKLLPCKCLHQSDCSADINLADLHVAW